MAGTGIIRVSWVTTALFTVTVVPAAVTGDALDGVALVTALTLFAVSIPVWGYALVKAAVRTTHGDDVLVASLFLAGGPVPTRVRWHLFGSLAVSVVVALATAVAEPFGVLVPMLPLGLIGLWGARHGEFPPRSTKRAER